MKSKFEDVLSAFVQEMNAVIGREIEESRMHQKLWNDMKAKDILQLQDRVSALESAMFRKVSHRTTIKKKR